MAKVGVTRTKKSEASKVVLNEAGGEAFEVKDVYLRLAAVAPNPPFNEPTYYGKKTSFDKDSVIVTFEGKKKEVEFNTSDLEEDAVNFIKDVIIGAYGKNPELVMKIASWARTEGKARTAPTIMFAVAAACEPTKKFLVKYAESILKRPDEIRISLGAFRWFFQVKEDGLAKGSIPHQMRKALAYRLRNVGEYGIVKYDNRNERPTFKDVVLLIKDQFKSKKRFGPTGMTDNFLPKEMYEYLVTGKVNKKKLPLIAAREELVKCETFNDKAIKLARDSRATWEVLSSQFGSENKTALWNYLCTALDENDERLLGYMATLRNLSNMIEAKVDEKKLKTTLQFLEENVEGSKQLPFRFISAYKQIGSTHGTDPLFRLVRKTLSRCLAASVKNLPHFPGTTALFADVSGSMQTPISAKSTMTLKDISLALCSIASLLSDDGVAGIFGDTFTFADLGLDPIDSWAKMEAADVGCSTNGHLAVEALIAKNIPVDRIVIFTDCQLWDSNYSACWWGGQRDSLQTSMKEYWTKVNKKTHIHVCNLSESAKTSPVNTNRELVHLYGGWHEGLLKNILMSEGNLVEGKGKNKEEQPNESLLEYIEKKY